MTITYQIKNSVYVNLTNRCPCACTFCIRANASGVAGSPSLWLEREPTLDEVVASLSAWDFSRFREVVFCGYGEPTERLDVLLAAADWLKSLEGAPRVRVNTNGLCDLINGEPTARLFAGRVDALSISLNTPDPAEYLAVCRPRFGAAAYPAMLAFAREAAAVVPEVVMTVVGEPVTSLENQARCRAIAQGLGARFRVRSYEAKERSLSRAEALALLSPSRRAELRERAHETTMRCVERRFDFCAIVNARAGRCTEDCKWCAQSGRWHTGCENHGWVGTEACVNAALAAEADGADRIGLVTAGKRISGADVESVCAALRAMRKASGIGLCASLGLVSEEDLARMKAAGLERVHCNIECAPSLFPTLCTTHSFEEKMATIRAAKRLGLQVCCGGIIGMGETDEQLVEFAFTLRDIAPDSIPVNVLHPIKGTPLGERPILDAERVVDAVALLRLVNPYTPLRFAGGRRDMSDETAAKCIYVGMSAGIAGPLLTTPGADFADDRALAVQAGYAVKRQAQ